MRHAVGIAIAVVFGAGLPAMTAAQESGGTEAEGDETADDEAEGDAEAQQGSSEGQLQRSDRMEFDARLIRGERASGAVFLFQRTPRKLPSMVERRRTYLEGSIRTTLGDDWAETFHEERERSRASRSSEDDESEGSPEGDLIDRMADEDPSGE
jgi:hypothetical protein